MHRPNGWCTELPWKGTTGYATEITLHTELPLAKGISFLQKETNSSSTGPACTVSRSLSAVNDLTAGKTVYPAHGQSWDCYAEFSLSQQSEASSTHAPKQDARSLEKGIMPIKVRQHRKQAGGHLASQASVSPTVPSCTPTKKARAQQASGSQQRAGQAHPSLWRKLNYKTICEGQSQRWLKNTRATG